MRSFFAVPIFILLALSGCAGSPTTAWNSPAATIEQWRRDDAACRLEASEVPTPAGGWASYDADKLPELAHAACLRRLGYRALPLTEAQLSALSVASYAQRKSFEERFATASKPETINPLTGG